MGPSLESVDGVVEEFTRIHSSLPARPAIDEVGAATNLIRNVEREEQVQVETISKQKMGFEIPEELFFILQERQKIFVYFQSKEQKREALQLLELESINILFDELIQRAPACLPSASKGAATLNSVTSGSMSSTKSSGSNLKANFSSFIAVNGPEIEVARSSEWITRDDGYVKKVKSTVNVDGSSLDVGVHQVLFLNSPPSNWPADIPEDSRKLSLIKLASLIEGSAKKDTQELNLQNKLMEQVNCIPEFNREVVGSGHVTLDL